MERNAKSLVVTAMTASQMRIAETIDAFYGDAGTRDGVSRSYKQAVEDLDAETIKALDGPYRCDILKLEIPWLSLTGLLELPFLSRFRAFALTFPTSMSASRNAITSYSTTILCEPR